MNFKDLINECNARYGLTKPVSVNSPIDLNTVSMESLMNAELRELIKVHSWHQLKREAYIERNDPITFVSTGSIGSNIITIGSINTNLKANIFVVSGVGINPNTRIRNIQISGSNTILTLDQRTNSSFVSPVTLTYAQDTYPVPDDYDRAVDRTFWNTQSAWPMGDPRTSQEWGYVENYALKAYNIPLYKFQGIFPYIIKISNMNYSNPIAFEYISKYSVVDPDGNLKYSLESDEDISVFDDELLIKGTLWRFKQQIEQDFQNDYAQYQRELFRCIAQEQPRKTLTVAKNYTYNAHMRYFPVINS